MNDLSGKIALITGASSGIGAATAIALAREGVIVAIAARRIEKLISLQKEIESEGGAAIVIEMDVANETSVKNGVGQLIEKEGKIDILFNNAGIMPVSEIDEFKLDEWHNMVDINVKGVLNCLGAVLPHMIKKESGHIFNTSSIAGRKVFGPGFTVYSATKFAISALSEGLRMELGNKHNIRVTSIQPGAVATELPEQTTTPEKRKALEDYKKSIQFLSPEDIAQSIVYAAKTSAHINVAEIYILPTEQI
ncbi:SDR family oxidoreductase [Cedecea neteri]|uniref:Oxidoreductase n=1 Tax=Cedecea neteri TaxID=158822 RepID=A0AAN0S6W4_9ENTR|nr:SDR family oxidoreductase [Cedecea neteri]AIR62354.1 oxidoreductase [Cedecea neteri]WNJ81802.1 SDR family oxidoreductase [Cedecea neteri]